MSLSEAAYSKYHSPSLHTWLALLSQMMVHAPKTGTSAEERLFVVYCFLHLLNIGSSVFDGKETEALTESQNHEIGSMNFDLHVQLVTR